MTDLYGALGVGKDANPEEIRKAYRKASKKAHPDAGGSAEKFALIALAAEVLGDDQRRASYDQTGKIEDRPQDKSMSAVMQAIDSVLNECARRGLNPETVDIVSDAKKTLKIQLEKMDENAKAAQKTIDAAKRLVKRFRSKGSKPNRLAPLIEGRIRQVEFDARNAQADRPSIVGAIAILDDHTFNWTDADQVAAPRNPMTIMDFAQMMRTAGL